MTWNLSDFDADAMAAYGVQLLTPDAALVELLHRSPESTCEAVREQMRRMSKSKPLFAKHCEMLATKDRLVGFVAALRQYEGLFGSGWPP